MQELTTFITHHPLLSFATLIVFILVAAVELIRARGKAFHLTPINATAKINHDDAVIIDIRANEVYRKGHIIAAKSLSAEEIRQNTKKLEKFKAKPLIFVCGTGAESQKVAAFMLKHGYNAYALAGGMRAWSNANMPIVKGE